VNEPLAIIADCLLRFRVKDVIAALVGELPQGLLGSLNRAGPDPLSRRSYSKLELLHMKGENKEKARLISYPKKITDMVVEVVWRLPEELVAPISLEAIYNLRKLELYKSAINLIHELHPNISCAELLASLKQHPKESNLKVWVEGWIERAPCFLMQPPIAANDHLKPLMSFIQMRDAARRFENCLERKIKSVLLGRVCYYEYEAGDQSAIVELSALSQGRWMIESIFGLQNAPPSKDTVRAIRTALEDAGALVAVRHTQSVDHENLAALFDVYDFDGGFGLELETLNPRGIPSFDPAAAGLVRVA
jgi:hypothetical protein